MARGFIADFLVRVTSNGLGRAKKDVDDLGRSTSGLADAHARAKAAAADHFNSTEKGIIGTANATKNFSKLAQGMNSSSGIVGAYATLAANVFAVTAAFNALRNAAQVEQVQAGLEAMGARMGQTLSQAAADVQKISGYTVSAEQAMRSTAQIMSAGLGVKAVRELTGVARDASFALGRGMTDSMDRLTRGVVKLEPELLDELGLMTKLTEATTQYANAHHKTEAQLTRVERQQAFLNAIVAEGTAKYGGLAEAAGNTRAYDELAASFANLVQSSLALINTALLPIAALLSNKGVLAGGMILFAGTIKRQLLPGLANMAEGAKRTADAMREAAIEQTHSLTEANEGTNKFFKTYLNRVEAGKNAGLAFAKANKQLTEDFHQSNADMRAPGVSQEGIATLQQMNKEAFTELKTLREVEAARIGATRAETEAAAITLSSHGKINKSFKGIIQAVNLYAAELKVANTGQLTLGRSAGDQLIRIRAGFYGAALAARVFGAAVLNAIPIIGQILLVIGLVIEGLKALHDWWVGKDVVAFNEALDKQAEYLNHVSTTITSVNKIAQQNIAIGQKEQLIYSAIGNSVAENIDAYNEVAAAQKRAFPDRQSFKVEDTAEYRTLNILKAYPGVLNQVKAGLSRRGLDTTILDKPDAMISAEDLKKVADVINNDLEKGVIQLGQGLTDLKDSYTATSKAVNDFNKSAIPSTPYDSVVLALNGVADSIYRIGAASARTGDFVDRMAGVLAAAPQELQNFFPVELQNQIKEFSALEAQIRAEGEKATKQERDRYGVLARTLALRSSEILVVQKQFTEAQNIARVTQSQIQLEQARLNKLSSFTALSAKDVERRRNAENHIIQLQIQQIKSQENLLSLQIQRQKNDLETNKILAKQLELELGIYNAQDSSAQLSNQQVMADASKAIIKLQKAKAAAKDDTSAQNIQKEIDKYATLIERIQGIAAEENSVRDMIAQTQALSNQISAQQTAMTSKAVIAAEGQAAAAQANADSIEQTNKLQTESLKLSQSRIALAVAEQGRVSSVAEQYNNLIKEQISNSTAQKNALTAQASANIANLKLERQRASEQGATDTVAILDKRIETEKQILDVQLQQVDVTNRQQVLEKFGFDTQTEGLKMQQDSLEYANKYLDVIRDTISTQREGENLDRQIARRRAGISDNKYTQQADEIRAARDRYQEAVREANVRKATITLEFALLEAQREQTLLDLQARRAILGETTEMGKQLTAVINNIQNTAGLVNTTRDAALANVDKNIANARKAYELAITDDRSRDSIGGMLRGYDELKAEKQKRINAGMTPGAGTVYTHETPLIRSQADLIRVTTDLVEVNKNLVKQAGNTAAAQGRAYTVGTSVTLLQAQTAARQAGLTITEPVGRDSGGHTGAGHREGRAFDASIAAGNQDSTNPRYRAAMDALTKQFVAQGFIVLWNGMRHTAAGNTPIARGQNQHTDHMHVEIAKGAQEAIQNTSTALVQTVQKPAEAATQAIQTIMETVPGATNNSPTPPNTEGGPDVIVTAQRGQQQTGKAASVLQEGLDKFQIITTTGPNAMLNVFQEMADKLGPQGQIIPAIMSGMNNLIDAYKNLTKVLADPESNFGAKFEAGAGVAMAVLNTISQVSQAASDARVAAIDREIAAEQKRDGKSAESLAKIQSLERKKDAIQRKQFNTQKKIMMAQAIIATASGVAQALGSMPPPASFIMAGIIAAMGAAQLAIIAGTSYESTSNSNVAAATPPDQLNIGSRGDQVNLAKNNPNAGGEIGYLRGTPGRGHNAADYQTIGSAYGGRLPRGYGNTAFAVGEHGPEIIEPTVPMTVHPANDIQAARQMGPVSFHIQALDAQGIDDILMSRRGHIIGMLREAANANGETFLEDVNTNVYTRPSVSKL